MLSLFCLNINWFKNKNDPSSRKLYSLDHPSFEILYIPIIYVIRLIAWGGKSINIL